MTPGQYFRSPQFQWSLTIGGIVFLGAVLAALVATLSSETINWTAFFLATGTAGVAFVGRLAEGIFDAYRKFIGEAKDRDVTSGPEPNPNPSMYLQ